MKKQKIAIVGAGLGGLTAGNLLAARGHEVTVFESHLAPGGYTAGFRRKGFYFESGTLSFEMSRDVFAAMERLGVLHQLKFVRQHGRFLGERFDYTSESYPGFREAMVAAYPQERAALEGYFRELDGMYAAMRTLMVGPGRPFPLSTLSTAGAAARMARIWLKYRDVSIDDFTARHFPRDSELHRLFSGFGYPGMAAFLVGGALATIFDDYWTVKDGMQRWADVLAEALSGHGGELLLKTKVEKIRTRDGRAVGVTAGGADHDVDWVIAAGDYKKALLELLDDPSLLPPSLVEKTRAAAVSDGIFTVYLGLSCSNDRLRESMKLPHVFALFDQPGAERRDPADEDFYEKCGFTLYSPSLHDPSLAPEGKSGLMLQAVAPLRWMDDWGGGDRARYRELKERVKDTLIRRAEALIPGLSSMIELSDAATPHTYERYTANTDGATSAWSWRPENRFHPNMMKTYIDTPVERLLIGSCWATQIGGIPGALNAALACAKRIG